MEARRLKKAHLRVCRPGVADLHHFDHDEPHYPDPDPHKTEKLDLDRDPH
jgi:hypothetical protein